MRKECSTKIPFDVQHRNITLYESRAISDFEALKAKIIARLKAIDKTEIAVTELSKEDPLTDLQGLSAFERIVLAAIVGNSFGEEQTVSESLIKNDANRNGLTGRSRYTCAQETCYEGVYQAKDCQP
ncbi:MAG TPA: hypothetical protein VGY91_12620 [Chthoniobacterales bacterium]|jgi:hypothetical protein|nr:hypothetical protein [Chthoniobacterales bacterium]